MTVREKEEPEQTSKSTPAEEEHTNKMLTPWEMELDMLEDWLNHPELVYDYHEETFTQMSEEECWGSEMSHFIFVSFFNMFVMFLRSLAKLGINLRRKFIFPIKDCCWDSEMSYFHPPFSSLFLTFHHPIKPSSYHFHKYIWVSHHYFPLYSF